MMMNGVWKWTAVKVTRMIDIIFSIEKWYKIHAGYDDTDD